VNVARQVEQLAMLIFDPNGVEQITPAPFSIGWNNELIGAGLDVEGECKTTGRNID